MSLSAIAKKLTRGEESIHVKAKGNRTDVAVSFRNGDLRRLRYTLIATKAGWRIYDSAPTTIICAGSTSFDS
ncbi:MAG: hypothetical protein ABIS39_02910 [Sphingomicrobium sp.]